MHITGRLNKTPIQNAVSITLLTILFAIAYTQSPLYTSNQNQYFLHGLAKAGFGYLEADWLANTLDPTPLFSWLVATTFRFTRLEALYYVYYALLMGLYLYCLFGIGDAIFNLKHSRTKTILFIALLFVIHSAALRFTLSRTIGVNWTYVLEDGVADQRMLGPVFQPSTFGVFLLLSVYLFLRQKPILAVLATILAATIHPTYILSAAILTATYVLVTYHENRNLGRSFLIGSIALLAISPTLIYVYTAFAGSSSEFTAQARHILVNFRIPHHADISQWFDATAIVKILLVIIALYLIRKNRLFFVVLIPLLTASLLSIIQLLTGNNFLALLFPWRISILLVPLSTTLIVAFLVTNLLTCSRIQSRQAHKFLQMISTILIFLTVLIGGIRMNIDFERKATAEERPIQSYIYAHKKPGEIYLTPVKMQDFRLFTGAPAFIDFKSIPYKDTDVLEWYRRVGLADQFYLNEDCEILNALVKEDHVTHVIIPSDISPLSCSSYENIYSDDFYHLYRLNQTSFVNHWGYPNTHSL
jgi:hypothetical protein